MNRAPVVFFGLLIVAGAGLLLLGLLRGDSSPEHPSPDPEWFVRATPKRDLIAHVRALDEERVAPANLAIAAVSELARQMAGVSSLRVELNTTRVLRSGHEYDSQSAVVFQRRGETIELRLEVTDSNGKPMSYRAELVAGEIARAGVTTLDESGRSNELPLDLAGVVGTQLPIDIGDLRLGDVVAFSKSFLEQPPQLLGLVRRPGAEELLAYELDLDPSHAPGSMVAAAGIDSPADRSGHGASALIYVQADDYTLRTIRVFDSSERLVRVYGDFVFERHGALPLPRMFTVTSIVTNSHSRFRIEALDIS